VHPSGQDDNLGDSALRRGLLAALRSPQATLHVLLSAQSSDYVSGLGLRGSDVIHERREDWLGVAQRARRPVFVLNAGEITLTRGQRYPNAATSTTIRNAVGTRGVSLAVGMGIKDPAAASAAVFDRVLHRSALVSWRDHASSEVAGVGAVAPDWAFALGPPTAAWTPVGARPFLAVTLRFDRPLPGERWMDAVRVLADRTATSVVTVAQVARDAPRAVRLAEALGGTFMVAPSTRHDVMERHVRSVYARSVAIVSDRAHALVFGATEGAYPLGSAEDPRKITRILGAAGLEDLSGPHDLLVERGDHLAAAHDRLAGAIGLARTEIRILTGGIRSVIEEPE